MTTCRDDKLFFYESIASDFDRIMNMYDLTRRVEVIYDELLPDDLHGKKLLDVGCGTGWFSKKAAARGASVTSVDLGPNLLKEVAKKCESDRVTGSVLALPFKNGAFDLIVSSEMIEHVPNYKEAIQEMSRCLKSDGVLVLTTPNRIWSFSLWIAETFHLRAYHGLERWLSWRELTDALDKAGFEIEQKRGIHLFPFVIPFLNPLLRFFDRFGRQLRPVMLNMAVRAHKKRNIGTASLR